MNHQRAICPIKGLNNILFYVFKMIQYTKKRERDREKERDFM